ncbi:MAG TPA: polysaccharide biosynthesis C-terminal domain-containing protein [Terriglobales bacterium]|nr:polysaccharide biosynthesis C-terminal domain-containing protein [Terriglobales bacterium]
MKKDPLKAHLITLGAGVATGRTLSFLQSIAIARMLGPVDLGHYATVVSICALLSRVGDFGLPHAFSYFARISPGSVRSLLRILGINILAGCVLYVLAIAAIFQLSLPAFDEIQASAAWTLVLFMFLILSTVWGLLPILLMAAGEYGKYMLYSNAYIVLQIALQYVYYFFLGGGFLSLFAANFTALALISVTLGIRQLRMPPPISVETVSARQGYRFGLQVQWGVLMKLASTRLEVPLVSGLLPGASTGSYSLASNLREATFIPLQLYAGIFQNSLIDRNKEPGRAPGALIVRTLLLQALLYTAIAVAAWLTLPYLIPLIYGPDYAMAIKPAVILVGSSVFTGLAGLCWLAFNSANRPHLTSLVTTISGVASPILIVAVAPVYGLVGVATASLGASMLSFALSLWLTIRVYGLSRKDMVQALREIRGLAHRLL